ncbi:hypothetical protein CLV63_10183 [Murinocardiopsis flavida]|uniref:Secreted protein n=1 Tax=Murinocardiopsis flavida TaxID=645275 RepID=A0A2P8DTS3_9ACTN|nr:hypothetical protein [Murinocardiopsis flavida]PSL00609.1 hypothetical protein CLV63_10183 [Murinocardiopsis flavida]
MNTAAKLAVYGTGLALAFGASLGAGRVVGPIAAEDRPEHGDTHEPASGEPGGAAEGAQDADNAASGLQISAAGYSLEPLDVPDKAGDEQRLSFRILDSEGSPVTGFTPEHEKKLHLIIVRRDMTGFQHVHPRLEKGGVWSLPMTLDEPGAYRLFADFVPEGRDDGLVLGADLEVPGDSTPEPLPKPVRTAEVDGYTVTLKGDLKAGTGSALDLSVSKDGEPVTDLQPYLGAFGHLVALRDGDLAYLHVHPGGAPGDGKTKPGPGVDFHAEVPSRGDYRLFFDFKHDGKVRTAEFTATTDGAGADSGGGEPADSEPDSESDSGNEGGHEGESGHGAH